MKVSKNILYFICCFLLSTAISRASSVNHNWIKSIYYKNSIHFGYDSNVLKYSQDERGGYSSSNYIALKPSIYLYLKIFKYKTKISLNTRLHKFLEISEKSNAGYSFELDQPIGNYQHIKFKYLFIDDIYLRIYDDLDHMISYGYIYNGNHCYFDLTKLQLTYVSPYITYKDKIDVTVFYETNYYVPEFTEYDLDITGFNLKFYSSNEVMKYSFLFGVKNAENLFNNNLNLLTEDYDGLSLRLSDRSYKEYSFKISYQYKINQNNIGLILNYKKRKYLSELDNIEYGLFSMDELHIDRKHRDVVLNLWYLFRHSGNKNKISVSFRNRSTKSPYSWVEDLKSFDKIYLEYTVYFDKLKFGLSP